MRKLSYLVAIFASIVFSNTLISQEADSIVQFIFTSDLHFGSSKDQFRGNLNVPSWEVNQAMFNSMKQLANQQFPKDNGVNSNRLISNIDEVIIAGDITSRMERGFQSAKTSWSQFSNIYLKGDGIQNPSGKKAAISVVPGNHDMSNAIGFHRPMKPNKDPSSMLGMYNSMISLAHPITEFDSARNRIHFSKNINGVHFIFLSLWPDSAERKWMENDLINVKQTTPVLLVAHSMPDVEARFFINPNGNHDVNDKDKFENLVPEMYKDSDSVKGNTIIEQKALVTFLKKHTNIKAYFHGHKTYTEYYNWQGPDHDINLPCIRSDSPIHGFVSDQDETKLAYEIVTINTHTMLLTVREVLWNAQKNDTVINWGKSINISLR